MKINKKWISMLIGIVITFFAVDFVRSTLENKEINDSIDKTVILNESKEGVKFGSNRGEAIYDYEMKDMNTGEIVKISDFKGKRVFLNFWASWCPPCNFEAPHLQAFHENNKNDFVVLGVNVGNAERDKGAAQEFIDDFNLTFTNVHMPLEMEKTFIIQSFPTSYLIDEEGVIDEIIVGPVTEEIIHELFEEIENKKS